MSLHEMSENYITLNELDVALTWPARSQAEPVIATTLPQTKLPVPLVRLHELVLLSDRLSAHDGVVDHEHAPAVGEEGDHEEHVGDEQAEDGQPQPHRRAHARTHERRPDFVGSEGVGAHLVLRNCVEADAALAVLGRRIVVR